MPIRTPFGLVAAALTASMLGGCGSGTATALPQTSAAQTIERSPGESPDHSNKMLYVASLGNDEILAFPWKANGNVSPPVQIAGPDTMLAQPYGVALDKQRRLYVMNDGDERVLIFPAGSNGDATPGVLGGSNTKIQASDGVAVDKNGRIYVSGFRANAIWVFAAGSSGNVAPIRTISGTNTQLSTPTSMAFDSAGDLYVANNNDSSASGATVVEFAPTADGNATPIATLPSTSIGIYASQSVSVDRSDRVIIPGGDGHSIDIFAPLARRDYTPVATISGDLTRLSNVSTTNVDSAGNIYATNYVSGAGTLNVFDANANGNVKPIRELGGSQSDFNEPLNPTVR